jgi:RTX calcium-binding nonapeptide repeat (4 copies)
MFISFLASGRLARFRAAALAPFTIAAFAVGLSGPAVARAADGFSCRASAARVRLGSAITAEPVRANAPTRPCSAQSAETLSPTRMGPIRADAVTAYTATPRGGAASLAATTRPSLTVSGVTVSADAVQASATVSCATGSPRASGRSSVVGLMVGGRRIAVPGNDRPLRLSVPLVGTISLNQTRMIGGELTQRALVVDSPTLGEMVLGEAVAGATGQPCGGGSGLGSLDICPPGSSFHPTTGLCVIGAGGGAGDVVIGKPYEGPAGGRVESLVVARKHHTSPCLSGRGPAYTVLGTNGANRITGTNRADRILSFGGRDRVDGGGTNDCVDTGSGNDAVAGGTGRDRVYGGAGTDHVYGGQGMDLVRGGPGRDLLWGDADRDRLWGGPGRDRVLGGTGNDRLWGGAGNDQMFGEGKDDRLYGQGGNDALHAGSGHDRLWGGGGRDYLETAIIGRINLVRLVDGGAGRDRALVNRSERRRVHRVERVRIAG